MKGISNDEGGFSAPKMWSVKRKLFPKSGDPPTVKKDKLGNLITDTTGLKNLYKETYKDRLSHKEISPELSDLKSLKENLFNMRLRLSK